MVTAAGGHLIANNTVKYLQNKLPAYVDGKPLNPGHLE